MLLQFIILITWQNYKDLWISSYTLLPEKGLLMNIFWYLCCSHLPPIWSASQSSTGRMANMSVYQVPQHKPSAGVYCKNQDIFSSLLTNTKISM